MNKSQWYLTYQKQLTWGIEEYPDHEDSPTEHKIKHKDKIWYRNGSSAEENQNPQVGQAEKTKEIFFCIESEKRKYTGFDQLEK